MRMRVTGGARSAGSEVSRLRANSRGRKLVNGGSLTNTARARAGSEIRGQFGAGLALGVFVAYLFSLQIYYISFPTALSSLLDEFLAVALVFYAFQAYLVSKRLQQAMILFAIYAGVTALGNLIFQYGGVLQPWAALLDIALDLKPFIIEAGFLFFFMKSRNPRGEMESMCFIVIILALLNSLLVLYDLANNGTSFTGRSLQYRNGLFQPVGFQSHQVRSAALTALGATFAVYFAIARGSVFAQVVAVYLGALVFAHQSAKEIVAFLLILPFFLASRDGRSSNVTVWVLGLIGLTFIMLATPVGTLVTGRIAFFGGESGLETARTLLVVRGFENATDHFPFGSGAGTFGSAPSFQLGYSDVYYEYGMNQIWGATRDNPSFLQDAYWGKILGQSGFSGTVIYIMLMSTAFGACFKLNRLLRNVSAIPACAIALLALLTSTASSPFSDDFVGVVLAAFSAYAIVTLVKLNRDARA